MQNMNKKSQDLTLTTDGQKQPDAWIRAAQGLTTYTANAKEYQQALSQTIGVDVASYQPMAPPILFSYEGGKQADEGGFIVTKLNWRSYEHEGRNVNNDTCLIEPFVGSARIFLDSGDSYFFKYILADSNLPLIVFHYTALNSPTLASEYQQKVGEYTTFYGSEQGLFNASCNLLQDIPQVTLQTWLSANLSPPAFTDRENWARSYIFVKNRGGRSPQIAPGKVTASWTPRSNSQALIQREQAALLLMRKKREAREVEVLCCDWQTTFARAQAGCIIYADPPYIPFSWLSNQATTTDRTYSQGFGWEQQRVLAQMARQKALSGVPVFISNHFTIDLLQLYQSCGVTKIYTYPWKDSAGVFACLAAFLPD